MRGHTVGERGVSATESNVTLGGIERLIAKHVSKRIGSMNIAVPIKGKDRVSAPIPFNFECYLVERLGDTGFRTPEGDTYDSSVTLFSLNPIAVPYLTINDKLPPEISNEINDTTVFTFGFLNCNFSLWYENKFYRIVSQRKVYNTYYVLRGELSI